MRSEYRENVQQGWQEGIDPDLVTRLLLPVNEPGVISMRIVRRILGWLEYLESRRALGTWIAERWARGGHIAAPQHPIVHAGWLDDASGGASTRPAPAVIQRKDPPVTLRVAVAVAVNGNGEGRGRATAPGSASAPEVVEKSRAGVGLERRSMEPRAAHVSPSPAEHQAGGHEAHEHASRAPEERAVVEAARVGSPLVTGPELLVQRIEGLIPTAEQGSSTSERSGRPAPAGRVETRLPVSHEIVQALHDGSVKTAPPFSYPRSDEGPEGTRVDRVIVPPAPEAAMASELDTGDRPEHPRVNHMVVPPAPAEAPPAPPMTVYLGPVGQPGSTRIERVNVQTTHERSSTEMRVASLVEPGAQPEGTRNERVIVQPAPEGSAPLPSMTPRLEPGREDGSAHAERAALPVAGRALARGLADNRKAQIAAARARQAAAAAFAPPAHGGSTGEAVLRARLNEPHETSRSEAHGEYEIGKGAPADRSTAAAPLIPQPASGERAEGARAERVIVQPAHAGSVAAPPLVQRIDERGEAGATRLPGHAETPLPIARARAQIIEPHVASPTLRLDISAAPAAHASEASRPRPGSDAPARSEATPRLRARPRHRHPGRADGRERALTHAPNASGQAGIQEEGAVALPTAAAPAAARGDSAPRLVVEAQRRERVLRATAPMPEDHAPAGLTPSTRVRVQARSSGVSRAGAAQSPLPLAPSSAIGAPPSWEKPSFGPPPMLEAARATVVAPARLDATSAAPASPLARAAGPSAHPISSAGHLTAPGPERAARLDVDIEALADQVQQKLLRQLAVERERRGTRR